jgi:hypothetical protein
MTTATAPGLGDRLCVFLRHDDGTETPVEWSIYAGGLEGPNRYYRIHYLHASGETDTFDTTIDLNAADGALCEAVDAYRRRVHDWTTRNNTLSASFLTALYALFADDPWMAYSSARAFEEVD